jgi:hypothetical protein
MVQLRVPEVANMDNTLWKGVAAAKPFRDFVTLLVYAS